MELRADGALLYRAPFSSIKDFRLPHKRAHPALARKPQSCPPFIQGGNLIRPPVL